MDVGLSSGLHTLGHVVEHVGRLVNPAALLACFSKDLSQRGPEAQGAVPHGQLRRERQSSILEIHQQLVPALLALAIAIDHGNQFLLPIGRGAHQDQQALPLIGLIFQANVHVDAVGPDVHVLLL